MTNEDRLKPFLLITGMHRSGTSFLSRAFNLHGVYLGTLSSLLSHEWKAYEDNPRGHWENKTIYELAKKTLKNNNGSWHKVPKKIKVNQNIGRKIKKCTNELVKNSLLASGFKDPRLILCFDSWLPYLPKNFTIVGIFRDPLKVAESLKKRNDFDYKKSLELWNIYNQKLLKILEKHNGFLLDFDWPKKKLFAEIELISKKLGLDHNIDLSEWYSKDLIKSDKTYKSNYKLSKETKQVYSNLKKRAQKNYQIRIKDSGFTAKEIQLATKNLLAEIHNQSKYFTTIFNERGKDLQKITSAHSKLEKEFEERTQWALTSEKTLKEKAKIIKTLQTNIDTKESDVKKLQNNYSKLDKEFEERTKWAQQSDKALKQQTEDLKSIQNNYSKLDKEFEERTKWAQQSDKALKQQTEDIKALQSSIDTKESELKNLQSDLNKKEERLKKLQTDYSKLEKEFEERTNWSLKNDEELKEKIKHVTILQTDLSTKESELQNLRNELNQKTNELNALHNAILFKIPFKIAGQLDKIPPTTKRGKAIRLAKNAFDIADKEGLVALAKSSGKKIKRSTGIKKNPSFSELETPQIPLKHTKDKIKLISNVISVQGQKSPDLKLRNDIQMDSSNILKLPSLPKVSIIIATYNQVDFLRKNLESIEKKSTYQNYEIIIVTNNLDKNSEMRKFLDTVKHPVYEYPSKYSFSGINNFGAKQAQGDYLLFLNDDVEIISPTWLEAMLKLALQDKVGAVGAKLLFSDGKLQEAGCIVWKEGAAWNYGRNQNPEDPKFNFVRNVDYCSGSCLMIKKDIFEKFGRFDEMYHPAYCEDADICLAMQKEGLKVMYQPLAVLTHHEGRTQGTDLKSGLKSFQVENQKKFKKRWKKYLETRNPDAFENLFFERDRKDRINILYIDHYVPEPDKDSGSLRAFGILGILAHMTNKITFWPDNQQYTLPYAQQLQQKGIEVIYHNPDFDSFLEERKNLYNVAILTRPYISKKYIDKIKEKMPNCKIIYDTIDLHYLRMEREAALEKKTQTPLVQEMRDLEMSLMKKSDITILTSPVEAELLHKVDSSLKFAILSNIHTETQGVDGFDRRKNMFFIGGFQHTPNIDSAKYLVQNIWPLIKQKNPDLKLYIVGSNPTDDIKKLESDDVKMTGFVKDLSPYYNECKVMLAPIRFGAGVKGKVTQSLAMGMPVITTTLGAEGINVEDGKHCMIADSEEDFAKKAIQVYSDEKLWKKLSRNGIDIAKEYSPENTRACLEAIFLDLFGKYVSSVP